MTADWQNAHNIEQQRLDVHFYIIWIYLHMLREKQHVSSKICFSSTTQNSGHIMAKSPKPQIYKHALSLFEK